MEANTQLLQDQGITIRPAQRADGEQMMQLVQELAAFEKEPDEVTVSLDTFLECGFGKNPIWWAWVAVHENSIVGFALYYIRYSTWKGPRLYLEDIIITERWRGKGIGKTLFDLLLEEAREKNFSGMVWQVLDWNQSAIRFYRKYPGVQFDSEWLNGAISFE